MVDRTDHHLLAVKERFRYHLAMRHREDSIAYAEAKDPFIRGWEAKAGILDERPQGR